MKSFKIVDERAGYIDWPETIKFSSDLNGYYAVRNSKSIALIQTTREEYFRYMAGERKHLFPDYDPKKHQMWAGCMHPENSNYENVPIHVNELVTEKSDEIPYGCFALVETNSGPILRLMDISADGYIDLGRKEYQGVYEDFMQFRKNRDKYASATPPRRHRSSMLMFGPPGNGKTREITRVLSSAKDDKFRAIFIGSDVRLSSLNAFKKAMAGEDVVFVIEEITERTGKREDVDQLLSFTDGELSWDHCYIIATTNYSSELPWNIIDRPGRFKTVTEVPAPKLKERIAFLKGSGIDLEEAQELAEMTSGLSIDYLSALVFDHYVTGRPFVDLLHEMNQARNKVRSRFKRIAGMSEGAEPQEMAEGESPSSH